MRWFIAFIPMILASCATVVTGPRPLSISEVWARHHELDGKQIRVQGVIVRCERLGCPIQETADPHSKGLGIGTSAEFDEQALRNLGKTFVVEGKFDAECLHVRADEDVQKASEDELFVVCTDRASMIIDPRIVRIR